MIVDFDLEDDSLPPPDDEPSLGDPEDDDLPSEEGKASDAAKSKFILPVAPPKAPGRNPEPPKIKAQGDGINLNLNSLTAGLTVKNPPSLLGKAGPVSNVPFSTPAHAKYSEPSSPPSSPQAQSVKSVNPSIVSTKKNEPTEDFRGQINPEASILNEEIIARCTSMTDVKQFVRNEALRMVNIIMIVVFSILRNFTKSRATFLALASSKEIHLSHCSYLWIQIIRD